jgi:hypothetical protein
MRHGAPRGSSKRITIASWSAVTQMISYARCVTSSVSEVRWHAIIGRISGESGGYLFVVAKAYTPGHDSAAASSAHFLLMPVSHQ